MKKLIPLLIVLAFISGVVYYQEQLIDMFLGSGNSSNQGPGASSGPPSMPAFDFGPSDQTQADDQSTDTKSLTEDTTSETQDSDLNSLDFDTTELDSLDVSELDDLDLGGEDQLEQEESSEQEQTSPAITSGPPSMPAFNFGPPVEPAPLEVASQEAMPMEVVALNSEKIKTPDLSPQEFKNSFLKFDYPVNITAQSVSLSSMDLNSIEDKLLNLSFFNNQDRLSVKEFVAESSNVTDFFENLQPESLEIENVDEVFVVADVALATKFYLIKADNIFVLIEMDIDKNYEFIEQIIIPSIESQIL